MEDVLSRLLVPDNDVIKAATEELRLAFKDPEVIPTLCRILTTSASPQIRQYAAVLLRKKFSKSRSWNKLTGPEKAQIKAGSITSVQAEPEKSVSSAICQLIGTLAKHELQTGWPELLQFVMLKVKSVEVLDRVLGLNILSVLAESAGEPMKATLKDWLLILRKTLDDGNEDVCYLTIVTLTHFVRRTGSDEATVFQQLIPTILKKIELLAKSNEEKATTALDIFDDLIECEVGIVVPHIKPMVELCIALAAETSLDDPIRIKAVTFLGRLTRLKKKTIVKHKLYAPMINVIFSIMVQNEDEDNDDDADEDEDTPALAASQALDALALSLPPEKYISALLSQVQPALAHASPFYQRAGYQALAVSAEGCQEHIRTKYLNSFLQILGNGIRHESVIVRNAALYMLGQFSEYIQPEISNYAGDILPVLFTYLDTAFTTLQPGVKESSSVSRIFYALDTFCENLEDKLMPFLPELMQRAAASLSDNFSIRIRELGINLIGSAANAVKGGIIPYFDSVLIPLQGYLTAQHTEETQVLLTTSMASLSTLARCVGKEKFSREFADKCITIGMQLVQSNDDPDVRKCAYNLFGAVASIVKEDMAAVMESCVTLMLKSLQSTEGITLEMNNEFSNLPLENLDDDDDEVCLDNTNEDDNDDLEDIKAIGVENAFVSEKEQALLTLKEISSECGVAFYPFIYQSLEESWTLLDYPDDEVRGAAILATAAFLVAYYKSGQADGMEAFKKGCAGFIPKLCEMVEEEAEYSVVVSALDGIAEMLKHCKTGATSIDKIPELIVQCVSKIMKKECACQDNEEEDGMEEEEEAEQDEMLFEYAGEVLPNLGRAMAPDTFAPYFVGLLPWILKKTRKQASLAERSFAVGALADCMEPLKGQLDKFLPHVMPVFYEAIKDSEVDLRNNGIYGFGEIVLFGGDLIVPHYNQILSNVSTLLAIETAPRVLDQIVGCVARFLIVGHPTIPVAELIPVLMGNIPLREDFDEYECVFRALATLYTAGHESIKANIPKILECSVAAQTAREIDRDTIMPVVGDMVKQIMRDFPAEFQAVVSALPPATSAHLAEMSA